MGVRFQNPALPKGAEPMDSVGVQTQGSAVVRVMRIVTRLAIGGPRSMSCCSQREWRRSATRQRCYPALASPLRATWITRWVLAILFAGCRKCRVPIGQWLRRSLRGWAGNLLDERRLRQQGIFNPEAIRREWAQHLEGRPDCKYQIWTVLMFQAWLDANETC